MASKTTLNAKNLEALGLARMAELLIEISTGNAVAKRHLRLALAGAQSPAELIGEIKKRLVTIARSTAWIDWRKRKALVSDLESQRRAIVEQVSPYDATEAVELLWRFLELANPVFGRCDDGSGEVIAVFHEAVQDIGAVASGAKLDPENLADKVLYAVKANGYGQYDGIIDTLADALGQPGLAILKQRIDVELSAAPPAIKPGRREVVAWGPAGPFYADEMENRHRQTTLTLALRQIADAQGDVDEFIAQQTEAARKLPHVAASIAQRLLAAGRPLEALAALKFADRDRLRLGGLDWEGTYIEVLEALDRREDAQTARLDAFERSLDGGFLRAFLKRLPDFEDVEAEEVILEQILHHSDAHAALSFFVGWPALPMAARLVADRTVELDGDRYEVLSPAAEKLSAKQPLAATLLWRAMITFALTRHRVKRYRHAAHHLEECERVSGQIGDYGDVENHDTFVAKLRDAHSRKAAFWAEVEL